MKKSQEIKNVVIQYKNDERAKERFTEFIIRYLIDKELHREEGGNG